MESEKDKEQKEIENKEQKESKTESPLDFLSQLAKPLQNTMPRYSLVSKTYSKNFEEVRFVVFDSQTGELKKEVFNFKNK